MILKEIKFTELASGPIEFHAINNDLNVFVSLHIIMEWNANDQ